jgi:hypothetical protein
MTTKLVTGGVILIAAIIFGLIFWNQFTTNQQDLAGGNIKVEEKPVKHESISSIEADLNSIDVTSLDSDSAQFDTELSGF